MSQTASIPPLTLPIICAPMFLVSGPDLVREACLAGIVGVLPRQNARTLEQFEDWLAGIRLELDRISEVDPARILGPLAVNLPAKLPADEIARSLSIAQRHGVDLVVSVAGGPREIVRQAHDLGMRVFHDVTSVRFAEKALAAGIDGLIAIGSGGGGHSGTLSHLVLIPELRSLFSGPLIAAGGIACGRAVRAVQALGADFAYMGTRFIATRESMAPPEYKQMLVEHTAEELIYSPAVTGIAANWLRPSLRMMNITVEDIAAAAPDRGRMLPDHLKPWKDIWSAGQAIDLIEDIPTVAELVGRLACQYSSTT